MCERGNNRVGLHKLFDRSKEGGGLIERGNLKERLRAKHEGV